MYIVISGNTGAGKSTLGRCLCDELMENISIEYVDEREFHHELVQQMFDYPSKYAFGVQMNFLLQRALKIERLIENKQMFLMERSLNEDFLFAFRHYKLGNINSEEFEVYKKMWTIYSNKLPAPALYIYLYSNDSGLLAKRIIEAHKKGERDKELANRELYRYVGEMNELYNEWFEKLNGEKMKLPIFKSKLKSHKTFSKIKSLVLTKLQH